MSKRKQRIDSATAAVKVMQGATRAIAPPAHVRMSEEDWPFWHSVIAEFARREWTDHQLVKIGRASFGVRVCQYVYISVVAVSLTQLQSFIISYVTSPTL